ncbi:sulfotransferase family 2 domain-containing protein [Pseudoroseicyclus aestuarii]|uniref:Sulfotransferase family protein n=1 Tax=Pseudoroseicyclus aestuarii TaxID=1795041 RepID=A0A318STI7_9RHOB|nr:sulfotransferase family 2 domain-containing protein [Pseudoroseicyclus aestuarii]PYE82170.1 sulfotransferase family protein [Pseudoroseicyclus aestuarii]
MPLARIGSTLLHFIHVPKTGGASVETYLAQKGALALKHPTRLNWSATTAQHMAANVHERLVPAEFCDHAFAVLRNPLDRLRSEWRWRRERMETRAPFSAWALTTLQMTRDDPLVNDNHTRPQVDFLREGVRLFHYSHGLDPVFDWIDSTTGTPPADRDLQMNRTSSVKSPITDEARAEIRKFYAKDYALLSRINRSGLNGATRNEIDEAIQQQRDAS